MKILKFIYQLITPIIVAVLFIPVFVLALPYLLGHAIVSEGDDALTIAVRKLRSWRMAGWI